MAYGALVNVKRCTQKKKIHKLIQNSLLVDLRPCVCKGEKSFKDGLTSFKVDSWELRRKERALLWFSAPTQTLCTRFFNQSAENWSSVRLGLCVERCYLVNDLLQQNQIYIYIFVWICSTHEQALFCKMCQNVEVFLPETKSRASEKVLKNDVSMNKTFGEA